MEHSWAQQFVINHWDWIIGGVGSLLTAAGGVVGNELLKARKKLNEVGPQLKIMTENHLKHIQDAVESQGKKQDTTNLELAEQTGYLKAIAESVKKA